MKKLTILLTFLTTLLFSDAKMDTYTLYQAKEYKQACDAGNVLLEQYKNDEEFVSLYAFSCLEADDLDRLMRPITLLKRSAEARANAAYFSVIVMQKKLLIHALADGYELSPVKLPTTEYVLSTVFDLYTKDTTKKQKRRFSYQDPQDPTTSYRLYTTKGNASAKIIIEEYQDNNMTKRHIYW